MYFFVYSYIYLRFCLILVLVVAHSPLLRYHIFPFSLFLFSLSPRSESSYLLRNYIILFTERRIRHH